MKINKIDLQKFRGDHSSIFTGRPQGESSREKLDLNKIDKNDESIIFVIPSGTTAITPSFFLGFLFDSINLLGMQGYRGKYSFAFQDDNPEIVKILKGNIEEGERHAENTITKKRGINRFIKK